MYGYVHVLEDALGRSLQDHGMVTLRKGVLNLFPPLPPAYQYRPGFNS